MRSTLATLSLLAGLAAAPALAADDISPADKKMLHDYVLSMDKVKAMQAVTDDLKKAPPNMREESKSIGNDSKSFGEMETRLKADAAFFAYFTKHGLNADDAVLMPFALMSAGMSAQYPDAAKKLSDQTSPAQVTFYKAHEKEIAGLSWISGGDDK